MMNSPRASITECRSLPCRGLGRGRLGTIKYRLLPKGRCSFKRAQTNGFTLIELIVVVGVFLVVVALSMPAFRSIKEKSQAASCANNMRQVGAAFIAYSGEHNGWFPPGRPIATEKIKPEDAQPGMPSQPGLLGLKFNSDLVPAYLGELPLCPLHRLTAEGVAKFKDEKKYLRGLGGSYALNGALAQMKSISLPWPSWAKSYQDAPYSSSKMPFIVEGSGSVMYAEGHLYQTLSGVDGWFVTGRNHGGGDALNFLFLDGHLELIHRNDRRMVADSLKSWRNPPNKDARFEEGGKNGRYITIGRIPEDDFKELYPQFYPPKSP